MRTVDSLAPDPDGEESVTRFELARSWFESAQSVPLAEREQRLARLREKDADLATLVEHLLRSAPHEDCRDDGSTSLTSSSVRWGSASRDADKRAAIRSDEIPEIHGYRVMSAIGSGAHGRVFKAHQIDPPRTVAIKVLRSLPGDSRAHARFLREGGALARMSHPGVVPIHSVGATADGRPYLVMEFVPGTRLDHHVSDNQATLHQRLRLMIQVCDAISHVHRSGVLHLDLKPANILVRPPEGEEIEPRVQVVDFGIARSTADSLTASSEPRLAGTLPYMSPEHLLGDQQEFCEPSDVFCLGVVTYELVTGQLPHGNIDDFPGAIIDRIRGKPPVAPREIERAVGEDLSRVILKALSKEPADRYPTTTALGRDLRSVLDGRPVSARPPSMAVRLWRRARRNPTAVLAGALVLALTGLWVHQLTRTDRLERLRVARSRLTAAERDLAGVQARVSVLGPANIAELVELERLEETRTVLLSRRSELEEDWKVIREIDGASGAAATSAESRFAAVLEALSPDGGMARDHGVWSQITRRIGEARSIRDTVEQAAPARTELTTILADESRSEAFKGAVITLPETLVPLGQNKRTGLWEFWHVPSGPRPAPAAAGGFGVRGESGLVFVLIPPGSHHVGNQRNNPQRPHYDDHARSAQEQTREVNHPAFLISKHELTVSQWEHLGRGDPYERTIDAHRADLAFVGEAPESLTATLATHGLALPTETQWELAARSGRDTPWWFGADRIAIPAHGNVADRSREDWDGTGTDGADTDIDDGYAEIAPVTFGSENDWGFFGVVGNAGELCRADFHRLEYFDLNISERLSGGDPAYAMRGGSFALPGDASRAAHRIPLAGTKVRLDAGIRPVATLPAAQATLRAVSSPAARIPDLAEEGSSLASTLARRWETAAAEILATPEYGDLRIATDLDLLPVGQDETTGLWEFLLLTPRLALIEALQIADWLQPGGASHRSPDLIRLVLIPPKEEQEAFFIGKYEMSQRHWARLIQNPEDARMSAFPHRHQVRVGGDTREYRHDDRHPVDSVPLIEIVSVLRRFGLSLPTASQWVAAAGPLQDSRDRPDVALILSSDANLASIEFELDPFATWTTHGPVPPDGYVFHAPTGSFPPNLHGLYDMVGNVWEWATSHEITEQPVLLGGSYRTTARFALKAYAVAPSAFTRADVGFRVARQVGRRAE